MRRAFLATILLVWGALAWAGDPAHRRDLVPAARETFIEPPDEKRFALKAHRGPGADTGARVEWKDGVGTADTAEMTGITVDFCLHQGEHIHTAEMKPSASATLNFHARTDKDGRAEFEGSAFVRVEELCDGRHTLIFERAVTLTVKFKGGAPEVTVAGEPRIVTFKTEERPVGGGRGIIVLQSFFVGEETRRCDYRNSAVYVSTAKSSAKWTVTAVELKGFGSASSRSEHLALTCDAPQ